MGGSVTPKHFKNCVKRNGNFQRGWRGKCLRKKFLTWERYMVIFGNYTLVHFASCFSLCIIPNSLLRWACKESAVVVVSMDTVYMYLFDKYHYGNYDSLWCISWKELAIIVITVVLGTVYSVTCIIKWSFLHIPLGVMPSQSTQPG